MASAELVQQLEQQLETINRYRDADLISRPDWGIIIFDIAAQDIELARSIAGDLSTMPLTDLTDQAAQDIIAHIPNVSSSLQRIDEFTVEEGDPSQNRNSIAANLKDAVARLHTAASQWIPYLAYKRGDFSANIRRIEAAVTEATHQLEEAETYAATQRQKVDKIVNLAREASASAGVATFTSEFDSEATALASSSRWWLLVVGVLAFLTLASAITSFFWPALPEDANSWTTLRHVVAKVSVIAILFTGTVWCGRIYRALRHQRSINRHRALSLKTFQAFVQATDDPATRDAVLMAATKSIFANVPTGFVEERAANQDASVSVLEIGKSAGKAVPTRKSASPEA